MTEKEELLVVKKAGDKLKFKVCDKETNKWSPHRYEKIIANRDYNLLAFLFFDLNNMGYKVHSAYRKFLELTNDPDLFFLK
jgi:hypothetical protein